MVGAVAVGDATKAAVITNGIADVASGDFVAASSTEDIVAEPSALSLPTSIALALAVLVVIGIAAVVWSTFALRRRAASQPARSSLPVQQ